MPFCGKRAFAVTIIKTSQQNRTERPKDLLSLLLRTVLFQNILPHYYHRESKRQNGNKAAKC
jgi:hypothetical protein